MGGDDEDVYVSQHMCSITPLKPHTSSGSLFSSKCPPLTTTPGPLEACPPSSLPQYSQPIPSAPLTCFPRFPMAPSSDRRAQRNRSRDPSWIPRPRNAFIIFRCEYSREHTQSGQELEDDQEVTNPTAKTLSKRAAEAWKLLSVCEKDRYKVLADKEREEHARLYPHYRFRPMRRQASGTKKANEHLHSSAGVLECVVDGSAHPPSVLAPTAEGLRDKAWGDPPPRPLSQQWTQPSGILGQRRSSSVPAAEPLPIPPIVSSNHRDRRSNSVIERARIPYVPPTWQVTAAPFIEMSSYSMSSQKESTKSPKAENTYPTPPHTLSPEVALYSSLPSNEFEYPIHASSPLATVTSSLIGWNGEFGPPSPSSSGYTVSSQGSIPPSFKSSSPHPLVAEIHPPHSPSKVTPTLPTACDPTINVTTIDTFACGSFVGADSSYDDMERAQALEAYAIGLHNYDLFSSPLPFPEYTSLGKSLEEELAGLFTEPLSGS
ncbi:hypothetical protein HYDPIDRAFT_113320 [Hydnomerulius pinastri MD-312]|uniref:HMG box domain-containing protein n=1 Tax=Hydnomerulius pinastri MD-312 TaxID=994086 RepID=A0A0C9VCK5_9AGAM|nr:hypothetical protein HYDPIDRAFT_113320 [Hydnomerulius pinastri MD-312]